MKITKKFIAVSATLAAILAAGGFLAAQFGFFSGGTNAPSVPEDTMTRGLVGYWSFDEGSGSTAYDASGNGNDGTLIHDPKWTAGKSGSALQFDGTDDYVDCGNDESLNITDAITIEAWVKHNSLKYGALVSKGGYGGMNPKGPYSMWSFVDIQKVLFEVGNGTKRNNAARVRYQIGTWEHFVGVYDSPYSLMYKNGVLLSGPHNTGISSLIINVNHLKIGGQQDFFNGSIDEVRIYNRALSAEEVRYHYNHGGPVASWNFDEGSGTVAYDGTANNNDGTLGGGTAAYEPSWVEGKYGGALSFDGVDDYVDCGNDESLNITDAITIEAWVKPLYDDFGTICKGDAEYCFYFRSTSLTSLVFYAQNELKYSKSLSPSLFNKWGHIAITAKDGEQKGYVNGQLIGTETNSITFTPGNNKLEIGSSYYSYRFNGSIDEVRIYNYARTPEQILQDYNAGKGVYFK